MKLGHDFHWGATSNASETESGLMNQIKSLIDEGYCLRSDIQVLVGTRRGPLGVNELNKKIQTAFNKTGGMTYSLGDAEFKINDKIICTRNNYDLGDDGVFNGTMGVIDDIFKDEDGVISIVTCLEGEGHIVFTSSDITDLQHAYALTVHKSQGSEFRFVLIPLDMSQAVMLTRNWIYTAITRAKERCYLSGSRKALGIAVNTVKEQKRQTNLHERLTGHAMGA